MFCDAHGLRTKAIEEAYKLRQQLHHQGKAADRLSSSLHGALPFLTGCPGDCSHARTPLGNPVQGTRRGERMRKT